MIGEKKFYITNIYLMTTFQNKKKFDFPFFGWKKMTILYFDEKSIFGHE